MGLTPRVMRVDSNLMPYESTSFHSSPYGEVLAETWQDQCPLFSLSIRQALCESGLGNLWGGHGAMKIHSPLGDQIKHRFRRAGGRSARPAPTTRALPIMKARRASGIPVSVQPSGKPLKRSSSTGTRRRRCRLTCCTCLNRDALPPPSPVSIVRDGRSIGSGTDGALLSMVLGGRFVTSPLLALRALEVLPRAEPARADEEDSADLFVGDENISEGQHLRPRTTAPTTGVDTLPLGITPAVWNVRLHLAISAKVFLSSRASARAMLGETRWVEVIGRDTGRAAREDALVGDHAIGSTEVALRVVPPTMNTRYALGETVVGGVHHRLHQVAELVEADERWRSRGPAASLATSTAGRRSRGSSWADASQAARRAPTKTPFLPLMPRAWLSGLGDGVILARPATDEHIESGYRVPPGVSTTVAMSWLVGRDVDRPVLQRLA